MQHSRKRKTRVSGQKASIDPTDRGEILRQNVHEVFPLILGPRGIWYRRVRQYLNESNPVALPWWIEQFALERGRGFQEVHGNLDIMREKTQHTAPAKADYGQTAS